LVDEILACDGFAAGVSGVVTGPGVGVVDPATRGNGFPGGFTVFCVRELLVPRDAADWFDRPPRLLFFRDN
jgi:hypothetical protein